MLVNMKEMLAEACKKGYAVGGFNLANLESARAAIQAAEELGIPFILQHAPAHKDYISVDDAAPIMLTLAKQAKVPVCVHLDHGDSVDYCLHAMKLGFTSVMFDGSALPFEENVEKTRYITKIAHAFDITVEAEIGSMPHNLKGEMTEYTPEDFYTDPEDAKNFAQSTDVDALAISFGTVHGIYKSTPKLSFDVVRKIRESTGNLPLVMHGGSGLTDDDYRQAIAAGIRKINYYTYGAVAGGKAVYEIVKNTPTGLLYHDVVTTATEAIKQDILRVMKLFCEKAE